MTAILGANRYGKSLVRLVTVTRHGARHELRDLTASILLEGEFAAAHVAGDNRAILPTDTMKNTVYALAAGYMASAIEEFGSAIGRRLLAVTAAASKVTVDLTLHAWDRVRVGERPHDHAFLRGSSTARLARVEMTRASSSIEAGVTGLGLLKTTGSAFTGFLADDLTTLRETRERILATDIEARWRYGRTPGSFELAWRAVRDALVETFADHDSESVQHTLFAMGTAALERCDELSEITLRMPNRHHVPVDLMPLGQENRNEVFVATEAPFGLIEGTVRRETG